MSKINETQSLGIRPIVPPLIDEALEKMPASTAGIKSGGLITAINGKTVSDWTEVVGIISAHAAKPITITWQYLEPVQGLNITPELLRSEGKTFVSTVIPNEVGKNRHITESRHLQQNEEKSISPESMVSGVNQTWKMSAMTVQGFG